MSVRIRFGSLLCLRQYQGEVYDQVHLAQVMRQCQGHHSSLAKVQVGLGLGLGSAVFGTR